MRCSGTGIHGSRIDDIHSALLACRFRRPRRYVSIIKAIIRGGGNVHAADDRGCKALHLAAYHGEVGSVHALIDAGACIEDADVYGWTPLIFAASSSSHAVILGLLHRGASVSAQSHNGRSPLYLARLGLGQDHDVDAVVDCLERWGEEATVAKLKKRSSADMTRLGAWVNFLLGAKKALLVRKKQLTVADMN